MTSDSGVEAAGDLEGAVGGAGVYDEDLVGEGDAGEGAREVLFFVEGDDRDGQERHRGRSFLRRSFEGLGEGDAGVVELLAEQAFGESAEVFAGFGEGEGVRGFVPLEFVGGGERGDPDLANGGVGGEDELGGTVFEENVEDAVLLVGLEAAGFFGAEEGLLERFEGLVGFVAEGGLVDHAETSVTVGRAAGRGLVLRIVRSEAGGGGSGGFEVQGGVGEGEGLAGEGAEMRFLERFGVSDGIAGFVGLFVAGGGDEQEAMFGIGGIRLEPALGDVAGMLVGGVAGAFVGGEAGGDGGVAVEDAEVDFGLGEVSVGAVGGGVEDGGVMLRAPGGSGRRAGRWRGWWKDW